MRLPLLAAVVLLVHPLPAFGAEPDAAPSGVYTAEEVPGSPKMTAAGVAWWKDRLVIADRGGKRLVTFTPPDGKFETLREVAVPVGLATDPDGNLILTEKEPPRVVRADRHRTASPTQLRGPRRRVHPGRRGVRGVREAVGAVEARRTRPRPDRVPAEGE